MRVRDVARELDVSQRLVYALIAAGKLRCVRHGLGRGAIRVLREHLEEYLRGQEAPADERLKWIR